MADAPTRRILASRWEPLTVGVDIGGTKVRARVAERLRVPVVVDNDANAAALAESRFGAGRGHRFVLCVTLGTGIGGALVLDNRVYRGANGMAGEFGHIQVVPEG